jgi:hypothetical protein
VRLTRDSSYERHRRASELARRRRQRLFPLLGALVLLVVTIGVLSSGGGTPTTTTTSAAPQRTTAPTSSSTTSTTDPGVLAQTTSEPSTGQPLTAQMTTLFHAIQTDSHPEAMSVFFPKSAYLQMKTGMLADPSSDYDSRLVGFYDLDLAAYNHQLGAAPTSTRLTQVLVNPSDAAWIAPGTCENKVGYWHLPGVRLVYLNGGTTYSFRVASLISWRDTWYVVHLGPNPRPSNVGTVDDPQTGPGTPGPPGGC